MNLPTSLCRITVLSSLFVVSSPGTAFGQGHPEHYYQPLRKYKFVSLDRVYGGPGSKLEKGSIWKLGTQLGIPFEEQPPLTPGDPALHDYAWSPHIVLYISSEKSPPERGYWAYVFASEHSPQYSKGRSSAFQLFFLSGRFHSQAASDQAVLRYVRKFATWWAGVHAK